MGIVGGFTADKEVVLDVFRYAGVVKSPTSKPLIGTVKLKLDGNNVEISGIDDSGIIQTVIMVGGVDGVNGENVEVTLDIERALKFLKDVKGKTTLEWDEDRFYIRTDDKQYEENLPEVTELNMIPYKYVDGKPLPDIKIDGENLIFNIVLRFNGKIKFPSITLGDRVGLEIKRDLVKIILKDEISKYQEKVNVDVVKWSGDEEPFKIALDSEVAKVVFSFIDVDTDMYIHDKVVYILKGTPWGYAGFMIPVEATL